MYVLGDGHGNVINGQAPFLEQILPHVGQSSGRVDGVAAHSILFKVWRRIAALKREEKQHRHALYLTAQLAMRASILPWK